MFKGFQDITGACTMKAYRARNSTAIITECAADKYYILIYWVGTYLISRYLIIQKVLILFSRYLDGFLTKDMQTPPPLELAILT